MRSEDDEYVKGPRLSHKPRISRCDSKIKFYTRASAEKNVVRFAAKGRGYARVYECGKHFHLTSMHEQGT